MKLMFAGSVFLLASTWFASGQTVQQKDVIAGDKAEIAEYAKGVNATCGTHIGFAVNYLSFGKDGGVTDQHRPSRMMQAAGDALRNACSTSEGRRVVRSKVHSVRLVYGENEAETLAGGVFTYKVGYGGGHPDEWLKAHLGV